MEQEIKQEPFVMLQIMSFIRVILNGVPGEAYNIGNLIQRYQ